MAHFERIRDVISGPFDSEVIRQRTAAGWKMVSIEWRRELPESESPSQGAFRKTSLMGYASPMIASGWKWICWRTGH